MVPLLQHRNRIVRVDQTRLASNALAKTFLSAAMAASSGTLTVKDIAGFAIAKYVWINPFGANSEIIAVHASTAPSGSTLTLAANTAFAHAAGEVVLYIEFNQIEYNHAATVAGSKTVLATTGILARERETPYLDITQTTGYYFGRFKDSVGTTYSSYSDPVPYGGWDANTVGYMIDRALRDTKNKLGDNLTLEDCFAWITDGLQEIKGKQMKWPEHAVSNAVIGQATRGSYTETLPTDIYDSETNRSIIAVRIGNRKELHFLDADSFKAQLDGAHILTVRTQAVATDTTLAVVNSYDLPDSGSVNVYVSGTKYTLTYTGITRSETTGILTGIPASGDGAITVTIPAATLVWSGETEGEPEFYSVVNGALAYWPLADAEVHNENVYLDYDTETSVVNSESDTIDVFRFDLIKAYLTWRVWCKADNNGKLDEGNGFYKQYKERLNDTIRTLPTRKTKWAPNINRMNQRGRFLGKADPKMLSNDEQ